MTIPIIIIHPAKTAVESVVTIHSGIFKKESGTINKRVNNERNEAVKKGILLPGTYQKNMQLNYKYNFKKLTKVSIPVLWIKKVAEALNHYKRLNKKSKTGKYRYKINKAGIVAYLQYKRRIEAGFDLNLHRRFPKRVESYSGITKQGVLELGLEAGEEAQRAE